MALAGKGWPGPQPARTLPDSPCLGTLRKRGFACHPYRGRRGFLRRPRPSAPPSATSSPRATPVQRCGSPRPASSALWGQRSGRPTGGPALHPSPGARSRGSPAGPRTWAEREPFAGRFSVTVASPEWPPPETRGGPPPPRAAEERHTSAERSAARLSQDLPGRRLLYPASRAAGLASYVSREPAPRYSRRAPSSHPLPSRRVRGQAEAAGANGDGDALRERNRLGTQSIVKGTEKHNLLSAYSASNSRLCDIIMQPLQVRMEKGLV